MCENKVLVLCVESIVIGRKKIFLRVFHPHSSHHIIFFCVLHSPPRYCAPPVLLDGLLPPVSDEIFKELREDDEY